MEYFANKNEQICKKNFHNLVSRHGGIIKFHPGRNLLQYDRGVCTSVELVVKLVKMIVPCLYTKSLVENAEI